MNDFATNSMEKIAQIHQQTSNATKAEITKRLTSFFSFNPVTPIEIGVTD